MVFHLKSKAILASTRYKIYAKKATRESQNHFLYLQRLENEKNNFKITSFRKMHSLHARISTETHFFDNSNSVMLLMWLFQNIGRCYNKKLPFCAAHIKLPTTIIYSE